MDVTEMMIYDWCEYTFRRQLKKWLCKKSFSDTDFIDTIK